VSVRRCGAVRSSFNQAIGFTGVYSGAVTLESGYGVGPYEILAVLGSGGMGTVYLARDTRLDRRVALKFIQSAGVALDDEESRRRVLHEARAASALNHPNICQIYDVGGEGRESTIDALRTATALRSLAEILEGLAARKTSFYLQNLAKRFLAESGEAEALIHHRDQTYIYRAHSFRVQRRPRPLAAREWVARGAVAAGPTPPIRASGRPRPTS